MPATWHDPRVPPPEDCVLRPLLERRTAETPDKVFIRFADGSAWTYRQTLDNASRTAAGLHALGVRQGEHVLSWLPNGPDAIRVWFGLNLLGAVYVPINLAYKGRLLAHVVENSDASLIVAHADLVARLADIDRAKLNRAVVLGGAAPSVPGIDAHPASALASATTDLPPLERPIAPWDTQTIIYTSGTTGPSKGVLSSYLQLYSMGTASFHFLGADDRYMVNLPLFHVGGTAPVYTMLIKGGSLAIVDAFDTASFWRVIRETETTTVVLLGVMATFLVKQAPGPQDRGHGLRTVIMVPLCEDAAAFSRRFGCDVYTVFNMTEVSAPLTSDRNPTALGSCGRPRDGVEVRIVDENDCEVAPGETGELIVRTDRPWAMNHGYYKNPEATVRAWRNGWFHTGDAFRRDANGDYFFVDRMKDAIRRRGENISSFEVETEVCAHPAVKEAAAVAVASEFAEDEVLVAVSLADGASLDPAALIQFLIPRMAHFMVPRYVRIVPELPKTPTQKVQKHLLRSDGITRDTFDREQAGIRIKREKIGT
ncbi:AMP-binding protein [Reyranella sp. CPCC 100927]|uniref:AMP-binding protein n=1 Tax=Reyranella sp. CPCC 100927 TaxID=2599616 RepID=UPI0011B5C52A|nr:AMP-binding protein [Reyranella sp. CPCC 100927]TWS96178.1 ATP-dependent acyl-CoA ligase [Reyranella sp. CPCC 100927]